MVVVLTVYWLINVVGPLTIHDKLVLVCSTVEVFLTDIVVSIEMEGDGLRPTIPASPHQHLMLRVVQWVADDSFEVV